MHLALLKITVFLPLCLLIKLLYCTNMAVSGLLFLCAVRMRRRVRCDFYEKA